LVYIKVQVKADADVYIEDKTAKYD